MRWCALWGDCVAFLTRALPWKQMEIQKKRVTLLSHQTCKGMARVYGVNYDVTEFGNILNQAYKVRARNQAATRGAYGCHCARARPLKAGMRRLTVRMCVHLRHSPPQHQGQRSKGISAGQRTGQRPRQRTGQCP